MLADAKVEVMKPPRQFCGTKSVLNLSLKNACRVVVKRHMILSLLIM